MIPSQFRGAATPLGAVDFVSAASLHDLPLPALLAVWAVECGGAAFLSDGRPAILYEAHIFARLTGARFTRSHPDLSAASWDRSLYSSSRAGEYLRLEAAMALDRTRALMAASWGGCQILGSNHLLAGFDTVDEMVAAMCNSEARHLAAFLAFVRARGLLGALRSRDWDRFARGYNGSAYRLNRYAERLAEAERREGAAMADGILAVGDRGEVVRRAQMDLTRAGFPLVADGVYGGMTARAVAAYRQRAGLPAGEALDMAALHQLAANTNRMEMAHAG